MSRREFIKLVGGAAPAPMLAPLAARAPMRSFSNDTTATA
jgi:hypothetical protein